MAPTGISLEAVWVCVCVCVMLYGEKVERQKALNFRSGTFHSVSQPWKPTFPKVLFAPEWAMVFPVVMYGRESWTRKKAECRRIDSLEKTDAGKDWRQEEKGSAEDEMVGWHHRLNGHEFEPAPGDGGGQRSLVCCSPWGCKESDTTYWLNNTTVVIGCFCALMVEFRSCNRDRMTCKA